MTRDEFRKALARLKRQHKYQSPLSRESMTESAREAFVVAFEQLVERYQNEVHYSPELMLGERVRLMVEESLFIAGVSDRIYLGGNRGLMTLLTEGRRSYQEMFQGLGREGAPVPLELIGAILGEYDRRIAIMRRGRPAPTERIVFRLDNETGQYVGSVEPVGPPNN